MAAGGEDAKRRLLFCSPEHKTDKLSAHGGDIGTAVERVPGSFGPSYNAPMSSDNIHGQFKSKCWSFIIKSISAGNVPLVPRRTDVLVMLCVTATLLDPLFCYILVVNEEGNCIRFDEKLRVAIVVLRSLVDFCYIIFIILQIRTGYKQPCDPNDGRLHIVMKYLLSNYTVDVVAVIPVTQVMIFFVIPLSKASRFTTTIRSMMFVLALQHWPRIFRVFITLRKVRLCSGIFTNIVEAKAIFNLFLYLLVCHILGAYWYLFSIERRATCLQVKCHSHPYCPKSYNNNSLKGWCMDVCSAKPSSYNATAFNFGIFEDAFKSGVVYSSDFIWKLSYCYWWGLQNLSSLGQGLKTSTYIWEIYFAISIPISGLVLFALLIGNLQMFLQAPFARQEDMRLQSLDIERWMHCHSLPRDLVMKIEQHENCKWQKTRGVDVEKILQYLPRNLRRETIRHLCFDAIKSVPMFQSMDEKFFDAVCGYLKGMVYIEHSVMVHRGELVDKMIFIIKGNVLIYSNSVGDGETVAGSFNILKEGDYFGEDLLKCAFKVPLSSTVPISTKTVSARTEVEAFVLSAKDLNRVISRFWWLFSQEHRNDPNCKELRKDPIYKEPWAPWASLVIQTAWRTKKKREKEKSQLRSLAIESGNSQPSPSVATNIHASTSLLVHGVV